jgi:hypothetical protein
MSDDFIEIPPAGNMSNAGSELPGAGRPVEPSELGGEPIAVVGLKSPAGEPGLKVAPRQANGALGPVTGAGLLGVADTSLRQGLSRDAHPLRRCRGFPALRATRRHRTTPLA